jgi:tetratricopeptide (TPR) repeat protein
LAAAGEEDAARARHALALDSLFAAAQDTETSTADDAVRAAAQVEMDNLREAIAWSLAHHAPRAVGLAVHAAALCTYSAWRPDAVRWIESCEHLLDQDVDPGLQARWWLAFATQSLFARSPRAQEAARQSLRKAREVGSDWLAIWSLIPLVRGKSEADAEVPPAIAEMQRLLTAHPEWRPKVRIVALGTLGIASDVIGDHGAALGYRLAELEAAQSAQFALHVGVAANNVADTLRKLGRRDEAMARLRDYLAHEPEQDGYNAVYARCGMLRILFEQSKSVEAFGLAAKLLAAARPLGLHCASEVLCLGLALTGRHREAALLTGHILKLFDDQNIIADMLAESDLVRAAALATEELGKAQFDQLVAQGRSLTASDAELLLPAN